MRRDGLPPIQQALAVLPLAGRPPACVLLPVAFNEHDADGEDQCAEAMRRMFIVP